MYVWYLILKIALFIPGTISGGIVK